VSLRPRARKGAPTIIRRLRPAFIGLVPLIVLAVPLSQPASASESTSSAFSGVGCNSVLLVLANLNEVLPVDSLTGVQGSPIAVGDIEHNQQITGIAISPDARTAYVTANTEVTPIDLATGTTQPPIIVAQSATGPPGIADPVVSPDGKTLFVGHYYDVVPIDLATRSVGPPIRAESASSTGQMVFTPDGSRLLVGDSSGDAVMSIDVATRTRQAPIRVNYWPSRITVTPDGRWAYVASDGTSTLSLIDLSNDQVVGTVGDPGYPGPIQADPDGRSVLAYNLHGLRSIDVATNILGTPTSLPNVPVSITMRPDGRSAVIAEPSPNQLRNLDLASMTFGDAIPLPDYPLGVGLLPDQPPAAAVSAQVGAAGQETVFDASASTVACGSIVSYLWDFGDGSPSETTRTPTVSHTYASAGLHTATVTETDSAGTSTNRVSTGQSVSRNGGARALASATVEVPPGAPVAIAAAPEFTG